MATIQVRDVPDHVHQAYRRRAREAGMSLQEYLLAELVASAGTPTPAEVVADIERRMAAEGADGYATGSSVDHVRVDRDAR